MPPSFIIINEKIVITIIFDSLKLDLKIGKLMRWSNKLLILILCHLNILRILLKLRTFNLLNLFTFILILKRSFFLNFNLFLRLIPLFVEKLHLSLNVWFRFIELLPRSFCSTENTFAVMGVKPLIAPIISSFEAVA